MRLMIGNEIWVFLKKEYLGDIFGLLIEVTDDSLYVQSLDESRIHISVVPRENVAYCTTDKFPQDERHIVRGRTTAVHSESEQVETPDPQAQPQQKQSVIDRLNVYVNKQQVASIPVPPTFPIHEWNENILRVIMGNPEVKASLAGKVQKEIEYYPGEVYITIENIVPPSQMPDVLNENTFQMGGQPTTEFLNPVQMAQRLSKVGNGGNDGETKV
ncbi:hypothetical protein LCGC14_1252100 [marine sediment metagenome]|uniref:Uncharacterized protein n=1 Tax=marine sediment metagenome TaxID=412755 RepID=A0A0F9L2T5_9ZZZZ